MQVLVVSNIVRKVKDGNGKETFTQRGRGDVGAVTPLVAAAQGALGDTPPAPATGGPSKSPEGEARGKGGKTGRSGDVRAKGAPRPPRARRASDAARAAAKPLNTAANRGAGRGRRSPGTPLEGAGRASQAVLTPEDMLQRAMAASTPRARGIWARKGLALRVPIDRTTQSMLLRQLYLAHYEARRFKAASLVADQMVALGILPDVAHQDAARAKQGLGDVEAAAGHLRLAARLSPPNRRAFHWWTLGSLYSLAGKYEQAISAITRAARWGTTDKPLYQGHLAVVLCASGQQVSELGALIDRLAEVPAGQGYGRFILGQMAFYDRRMEEARRYLEAFVTRSTTGRPALAIALDGEITVAKQILAQMARS